MSAFLKKLPLKVLSGRRLSVWGPRLPPPLHTVWIQVPYLFTQISGGRGIDQWDRRKYQHDWLYLQSINSIKHQKRRHLGFGVFIYIWSICWRMCGGGGGGVWSPGLGLQQVNTPLINPQPEVARPVAGKGLSHIEQSGAVQRPTLDQVQKGLLCLLHLHSCKKMLWWTVLNTKFLFYLQLKDLSCAYM